ncbi:MAG: XTP/dITP diphosphatase [Candidatus Aquicultor sp.]|nr:XTP/dITP diphosphatase [Candidatus Aquicultor sp.]
MLELIIASKNDGKIREIVDILELSDLRVYTYKDFPDWPDVEETGTTFYDNALLKVEALVEKYGKPAVSDDSGLEVDALGGDPGVDSAIYAGEHGNAAKNNEKLLRALDGVPEEERTARFRCVAILMTPDGWRTSTEGTVEGRIGFEPHGALGFGYDPLFFPTGETRTVAEMGLDEKNKISHRGQAFMKMREKMEEVREHLKDS